MSISRLNAGKRSSPPSLVNAPPVSGLAFVALSLGNLVLGTVAGLFLRGPKYPLASGSGIVAMIKPTSAGLDWSSLQTSASSAESSPSYLSYSCSQNGRIFCASLFASRKCSRYYFSHSVSFMAYRFFLTFCNLSTYLLLYAMNLSSAFNSLSSIR